MLLHYFYLHVYFEYRYIINNLRFQLIYKYLYLYKYYNKV